MEKCEEISDDEPSTSARAEAQLNTGECSFSASSDSVSHNKKSEELEFTGAIDWADNEVDQCHFPNPLEAVGGSGVTESDNGRNGIGESPFWTQSITPGKFYRRNRTGGQFGTSALHALHNDFETKVLQTIRAAKSEQPKSLPSQVENFLYKCNLNSHHLDSDGSSASDRTTSESSEEHEEQRENCGDRLKGRKRRNGNRKSHQCSSTASNKSGGPEKKSSMAQKEIQRKRDHPAALHPDIGFNESGQLNDGPLCKCSWTAKQSGIRHDKFVGEQQSLTKCQWNSSSIECLHHYVLVVQPTPSAFSRRPTAIQLDGHCYAFDGFSIFLHRPLPEHFSQTPINQWTNDFQLRLVKENMPESFTVRDLELFHAFLFEDLLELYDLNRFSTNNFVDGETQDDLLANCRRTAKSYFQCQLNKSALVEFALQKKGQICVNPAKRPMAIRMDMIDAHSLDGTNRDFYPLLVHFGVKPTAYAFSKRPQYQDALKKHIKIRKTMLTGRNKNVLTSEEKRTLRDSEANLQQLKQECVTRRDTTILINSRGFYSTGLYPDIVQHSLLLVLMCHHIRFHCSLGMLENERLEYVFKNRALLELALIHPSFRANYGTNSDHAKNTINNCGLRMGKGPLKRKGREQQTVGAIHGAIPQLSTKKSVQQQSTRKRGIQALMEIMSIQGSQQVTESPLRHNERLEFLGDAVVEFLTTIHLFFLFSDLDEGGLATFRSALVQNRHLATLADRFELHKFMVYSHGPDLCHEADLRHAMANAFEALMAAIFLDSNLEECDRIFSNALFKDDTLLKKLWTTLPEHPLKRNNPFGDRHLIEKVPCLRILADFEESIGIRFKHIRLLAKAFTRRNVPYNYLTLGNNQRLEFLGDTVLQLLTTEYIYKHFPHHQEGHLSLLRTCLVSNKTQSFVCDELAMTRYLVIPEALLRKGTLAQLRLKDKADLNEAFIGALYVDRGLIYCRQFCRTCFFPRLKYFIMTQRWNDPKSQLQQCCLALREGGNGDPDIPEYKTIGVEGPTNTRVYRVAVYFRNKRLSDGMGSSVHQAQMQAAQNGLESHAHLFPKFTPKYKSIRNSINGSHRAEPFELNGNEPDGEGSTISNSAQKCTRTDVDAKNFESSWNSTPKFINNELQPRHGQKRSRGEENGDEPFLHPNVKRRTVSLVLERSNDSTGKGLKDKSYWTPRLEAIQQALQKSRQQNAGIGTVHHKWDSTQSKSAGSHFFFNNTPTRHRSKVSGAEDNGSQMGEANSPLLLPPPPPPPKLLPPSPSFDTEI
uniref:Ribonuclease 3 n=1 Tax=Globodera rostochiensis TaxID=31243 RepID=A0A914I9D7_GLORO